VRFRAFISSRLQAIIDWKEDLVLGDVDAQNRQLRPHIVWFGEEVPALEEAVALTATADFFAVMVLPKFILRLA
jgi:NAD-dependent SIR2 family protein deacetylase